MKVKAPQSTPESYKRPESVLVVVYTLAGEVLLLQRADESGAWQSVTGSMRWEEQHPLQTAQRELVEETGLTVTTAQLQDWQRITRYPIHPLWKPRYHPDQSHNTEHLFSLQLDRRTEITINPREHRRYCWLPFAEARDRVRFASNKAAIVELMEGHGPVIGSG
jgi:dATP pyrophosphohydrolase